jgi:hypothetical protein
MLRFIEVHDNFGAERWLNLNHVVAARQTKPYADVTISATDGEQYITFSSVWHPALQSTQTLIPAEPGFTLLEWYCDTTCVPVAAPEEYPIIGWNLDFDPPRPVTPAEGIPRYAYEPVRPNDEVFIIGIRAPNGSVLFPIECHTSITPNAATEFAIHCYRLWLRNRLEPEPTTTSEASAA